MSARVANIAADVEGGLWIQSRRRVVADYGLRSLITSAVI